MKAMTRYLGWATLILGVSSTTSLIYVIWALQVYRDELFSRQAPIGLVGAIVMLGFLTLFLFNTLSFIWVLHSGHQHKRFALFDILVLVLGALCLVLHLGEKTMIDEIGREMALGWETIGEQRILLGLLIIQGVYNLLVFAHLIRAQRRGDANTPALLKDDSVFMMAQVTGILCGLLGLWINFSFMCRPGPATRPGVLISSYVLVLIPYGITVLYWMCLCLREKLSAWYDEKQLQDVTRAAFFTLLLSVPGMAALFLVNRPVHALWFPHYLFLILLLFSVSTLYFYRHSSP